MASLSLDDIEALSLQMLRSSGASVSPALLGERGRAGRGIDL